MFFTGVPGVTLNLRKLTGPAVEPPCRDKLKDKDKDKSGNNNNCTENNQNQLNAEGLALRLSVAGATSPANPLSTTTLTAQKPLSGKLNYLTAEASRTGVTAYSQLTYPNVYSGTDLTFYGTQNGQLEYDLVVRPKADPAAITLKLDGASRLDILPNGDYTVPRNLNRGVRW